MNPLLVVVSIIALVIGAALFYWNVIKTKPQEVKFVAPVANGRCLRDFGEAYTILKSGGNFPFTNYHRDNCPECMLLISKAKKQIVLEILD